MPPSRESRRTQHGGQALLVQEPGWRHSDIVYTVMSETGRDGIFESARNFIMLGLTGEGIGGIIRTNVRLKKGV
jgi:hypothetical protein